MFDWATHDGLKRPGVREMTAMLAALMALNSFAIDAMIPALPQIGKSLDVARENDRQLVVIAYFIGFASTQLLWGPLADRFGRKPAMAAGVGLYGVFALVCAAAPTFTVLIAGRVLMGADGRCCCSDASAGGGNRSGPVRGRGDGAGDEPRLHDLHVGAGTRAQYRPGDPPGRAMARDLHRARAVRGGDGGLAMASAARDTRSRVPAPARLASDGAG